MKAMYLKYFKPFPIVSVKQDLLPYEIKTFSWSTLTEFKTGEVESLSVKDHRSYETALDLQI